MIMMLSLLYVYYVIVLVLKKRKKAPHKSQLLPKFKNDNHLKRSRAGMEKKLDSHQWTELRSNRLLVYKISSNSLLLHANL